MNLRRPRHDRSAGFARVLVLGAALAVALGATSSGSRVAAQQQPGENGIAPEGLAQIQALLQEKETRTPAERKIDSQLIYARRMQLGLPVAPGIQTLEVDIPYAADGHVIVDVKANLTTTLLAQLNGVSREIVKTSPSDLQLHVDLDQIEAIAAQPDVLYVQPRQGAFTSRSGARPAKERVTPGALRRALGSAADGSAPADQIVNSIGTGQGAITAQSDITHRTAVFRGLTGFNGAGVKIGVLADGVEHLAASQASADLGPVTVLPGQTGSGDEGTAMLEIIHDIAPGAQLYFATGITSVTSFAQNIRDLRAAGCDIIVDDVGYYTETPFQDGQGPAVVSPTNGGVVAQAVKDVAALGAMYFASAGNAGNLNDGTSGVWEGDFNLGAATVDPPIPAAGAGNFHRFTGVQDFNTLTLAGSGPISLAWSDPLGGSGNDYDIFRLNTAGTVVASSSTNIQNGNDDPYEQMSNSTASPRIVIVKKTGAAGRFLHLNTNRGQLSVATAGQIHGHAATSNIFTFAVAASYAGFAFPNPFSTSNVVETFSSDGPRRVFFLGDGTPVTPGNFSSTGGAVLQKPDITAADGVLVSGAGDQPGQFFGTSAAAPNAAAIMALLKSQNPGFSQSQLRSLLFSTALDIEAPGVDRDSGIGIVMAVPPQPGCTFTLAPPAPSFPATGGFSTFTVGASSGGCNWAVWSNVSWITLTGSGVGTGAATPGYTVANNLGPARSGTIMIQGGQIVTVSQAGTPGTTFDNVATLAIPDNTTVESAIALSGLSGRIRHVSVSFYLTHTFDADLTISLVSPDGTVIDLSTENGGSANNYGSACSPPTSRTTFDDSVANLITSGSAPFVGSFRPEQPLSTFNGKSGTAANGTWKLRIKDSFAGDTGTLQCWSIVVNTAPEIHTDFNGDGSDDIAVFQPSTGLWLVRNQPTEVWGVPGDVPVAGDYNGDRTTDRAVYRPSNGTWFVHNQGQVQWGVAGDIPVPGDYNGAGKTERAVYRPLNGTWFVRNLPAVQWGAAGDIPVPGDYNGDLTTDIAVYRPLNGTWFVRNLPAVQWGAPGDIPMPADYNGDGVTDIAVYRPSSGQWIVRGLFTVGWGAPGDVPVPGDYNGDGTTDIAVYRPLSGTWFVQNMAPVQLGGPGDLPVPRPEVPGDINADGTTDVAGYLGDFDGNGTTDVAVYRPTTGTWSVQNQGQVVWGLPGDIPAPGDYNGDGTTDRTVFRPTNGTWYAQSGITLQWGIPGDIPVPADYNGDGVTDIAVYRPSNGTWFVQNGITVQWGQPGDVPVPGDYNGDGVADVAVYRPSTGTWFVRNLFTVQWGAPGDIPVPGDYNGNGAIDIAIYRPSNGTWYAQGQAPVAWGGPGDLPVPGDFNGDGVTDRAVFRPSTVTWFVQSQFTVQWGLAGDIPASRAYTPR
jgi:subtilisin-like proprotein convertase family protein